MIWAITILARWGVPEGVRRPLAILIGIMALVALLAASWALWLHFHDKGVIERHEEQVTKQVDAISSEAAASASAAVDHSRNEVEIGNEQARAAASGSDDRLKSGLDRLRTGKGEAKPAPR